MSKEKLLKRVKSLNLPLGKYIVFGSSPLHIHGIRKSRDIDIFVLPELYEQLKNNGWEEKTYPNSQDHYLTFDNIEIVNTWDFGNYHPDIYLLIKEADIFDGIPFAKLKEVRAWKQAFGREKDLKDIELVDQYIAEQGVDR